MSSCAKLDRAGCRSALPRDDNERFVGTLVSLQADRPQYPADRRGAASCASTRLSKCFGFPIERRSLISLLIGAPVLERSAPASWTS